MDRNLRIQLRFDAVNNATGSIRQLMQGSRGANEALRDTRARLEAINNTRVDVSTFRQLKAGSRETAAAMRTAEQRVAALAREVGQASNPTRAMTRDLARARQEAASLTRQHAAEERQLQELRDRLRAAGVATTDLARHDRELRHQSEAVTRALREQEQRTDRLADRERRMATARTKFARGQEMAGNVAGAGMGAIGAAAAIGGGLAVGVKAAQSFESRMTDIAQKANASRAAAAAMGATLLQAARDANQLPTALQDGVDTLTGFGLTADKAVVMMRPIGRAATAYKAEIADLSAAAFAANDNLKVPVEQTARVIDIMAEAGKQGAFEVKDMAGAFPALTAAYQGLGQTGTDAVADLAAGLQILRKGTGDSATAATNMQNVLQKISSPATNKAFEKMGVDLPAALKKAYSEGKTPLEAIAELTNKTLKGDLSKLGYLFEDAQVQQGLRPLIQNMEEYRRIRQEAAGASGVTDRDFAERMRDSAEQSNALKVNAAALAIKLGSLLLPAVNAITTKVSAFTARVAQAAQRHPMLAKGALLVAGGLAILLGVFGVAAIAIAAIMGPIALLNAGLIAMGVAGGTASVGLLPIIGTVLLVVAAIAAMAYVAYQLYENWGSISAFFGGLWSGVVARFNGAKAAVVGVVGSMWAGVKALFSMSMLDIAQTLFGLLGQLLGTLYRFGASAFAWLTGTLPALLASGWSAAWSTLTGAVTASWGWLTTRLPVMLVNGWRTAWSAFKAAMYAAFVTVPAMFANFGTMIVTGIFNGIKAAPGRLWAAGKTLFGSLAGGFKAAAQIRSPSRVFAGLGGFVMAGLDRGLATGADDPVGRVRTVAARMAGVMAAGIAVPAIAAPEIVSRIERLNAGAEEGRAAVDRGTATRASIIAAPRRDGAGQGAAQSQAPAPITIVINAAAGQSERSIAEEVERILDARERRFAADRGAYLGDYPDGGDL